MSVARAAALAAFLVSVFPGMSEGEEKGAVEAVRSRAPELVDLAGSARNFESLVAGLAIKSQVTLVTPFAGAQKQVVRFLPPSAPLSAREIVRVLRAADARLAGYGIRQPDGQQLAAALVGGVVETATGAYQIAGVLPESGLGFGPGYEKALVLDEEALRPRHTLDSLLGSGVRDAGGQLLGTIVDFVVDRQAGRLRYALVHGEGLYRVPVHALRPGHNGLIAYSRVPGWQDFGDPVPLGLHASRLLGTPALVQGEQVIIDDLTVELETGRLREAWVRGARGPRRALPFSSLALR